MNTPNLFVPLANTVINGYNIIAASQGEGGGGKTHFWLTAPDPICYFLFEPGGLKGLNVNPLFRSKDVRVLDLSGKLDWGRIDKKERVLRGLEVMKDFDAGWEQAKQLARTIVIDKEDMLWETRRYAHDEVESPEPKKFHELNLEHRALIAQAEALGLNLGFIRGMKEVWGKTGISRNTGLPTMGFTGEQVPRGHKELPEYVQINLEHRWDEEEREFKVRILEKCRLGNAVDLMGQEFGNLDFPTLGVTVYPETDLDTWR
jgi:hypothetical protein